MRIAPLFFLTLAACAGPIPVEKPADPTHRKAITEDLRAHEGEIQACYDKAHDPGLTGRLILQWDIGEKGKVSQVRVVAPLQPDVDDCIAGALENWTFKVEPGQEKVRRVLYPFSFKSQ